MNQGCTVATILEEPRTQDLNVVVVTHAGATTREDGPLQEIRFVVKKNVAYDNVTEKETLFQAKHAIRRNSAKFPVVEMPSDFDPSIEVGSL